MKNKILNQLYVSWKEWKALALLTVMLLITTTQVWGYDAHFYLIGSWNTWNSTNTDYKLDYDDGDSKYSIYWYMGQDTYFALTNSSNTRYNPTSTTDVYQGANGSLGKYTSDDEACSDCSWKYTGNPGIVKICVDENSSDKEWRPWVWVERPTIVIKHDFSRSGGDWQFQNMTDNNDGTYQYTDTYSGGGANAGPRYVEKYFATPTLVGNPTAGDRCIFVYNASGYQEKSTSNQRKTTEHTGSLTIVKLCTIKYDGNGKTSGTVPEDDTDNLYSSDITLSSTSLTKTGYYHSGWNTASDGSGTHYALGGSLTPSSTTLENSGVTSLTLYAEWKQWTMYCEGSQFGSAFVSTGNTNEYSLDFNTSTTGFNAGAVRFMLGSSNYHPDNCNLADGSWHNMTYHGDDGNFEWQSAPASGADYRIIIKLDNGTWKVKASPLYTVTYAGNGSDGGTLPTNSNKYITSGTFSTATNTLTKTGYYFTGWNDGTTNYAAGTTYTVGSTNITLTAQWSPTWSLAGGASGEDSWNTNDHTFTTYVANDQSHAEGRQDVTLDANTTYWVKMYNNQTSAWHGLTSDTTAAHANTYYATPRGTPWGMTNATGNQNLYIHTAAAGTYQFAWDTIDKVLYVTYPTSWYITSGFKTPADNNLVGCSLEVVDNARNDLTGGDPGKFVANNATVTLTPTVGAGYTFNGWYSDASCTTEITAGTGIAINASTHVLTLSSITADKTAYAKLTPSTYTVTFNARGGSGLSVTSKNVTMGAAYGTLATVTAPTGYVFDGWYTAAAGGTKVTDETIVATASDHTLYAHYSQKALVYFKNNLGWSNVYVTFDAPWNNDRGTGNKGKWYKHMTLVSGTTDIYCTEIPDYYLNTSWAYNIAFNNTELGSVVDAYDEHSANYESFNSGEAVFRMDFDSKATMFVPTTNRTNEQEGNFKKNSNSVQYYSTGYSNTEGDPHYTSGYWIQYNSTQPAYHLTYQLNGADSWTSEEIEAPYAGDTIVSHTLTLNANSQYNFSLYKTRTTSNTKGQQYQYGTQITSSACTDLKLTNGGSNAYMQTTVAGDYVFTFRFANDGHIYLSVTYPLAVDDYRVKYAYTKGGNNYVRCSERIKYNAASETTISMFIHSGDSASSRSLTIEYCSTITSGVPTWTTTGNTITLPTVTEHGNTGGVYNFVITQHASGTRNATGAYSEPYSGNYYIRTACSDGKWDLYKYRDDNVMTYSDYSMTQTLSAPYSHYYCRYVSSTDIDITYTIATDYSPSISDTLIGDATIGGSANTTLPSGNPANIRFTWNEETNALRRAYLKSAQGIGNTRYLVLHGDNNIFDASTGNAIPADVDRSLAASELLFTDLGNWIYQVELQAYPSANVKLIAKYNDADRYLIGDNDHSQQIMGGTPGSTKYAITAVYDFKTNRLMTVWTPSGEISDALTNVDLLLIREAQGDATSISFGTGGALTAKKVYGAIKFDYTDYVGHVANWTPTSRPWLKFMISFPFDVKMSDLFGLNSRYGDAYIIQKYDGADRAARGFFRGDGTTTFWKDMTTAETLEANVGYCLILDNDYFNGDIGSIWENKNESSTIYLYFPSADNVGGITSTSKVVTVTAHPCYKDQTFTVGSRTLNHKYTDSNWNLIGVPIFQNSTGALDPATIASENTDDQTGDYGPFYYFYDYDVANNRYSIASAEDYEFKTMYSYMLQYAGTVTFTGTTPSAVAARRIAETKKYEVELQVLNSDNEMLNRTYVNLKENACDTFALNEDVYMSYNSHAVNIYTLAGNYDVAANILSIDDHIVPVGVEVARAGRYTFSMPSEFSGTVTLVDNFDGSRTDLSLGDYSVALPKGIIEDRFTLEINIARSTTTDIEGIEGGTIKDGKAHKFVRDGIMYILRDGVIYDARGARMKSER